MNSLALYLHQFRSSKKQILQEKWVCRRSVGGIPGKDEVDREWEEGGREGGKASGPQRRSDARGGERRWTGR